MRVSGVWSNEQREQLAVAAAYLPVAIAVRLGIRDDTEPLFTQPNQFLVRLLAHELDQLVLVGDVDRIGGVVCLGGVGAPPVQVVATGSPTAPVVLTDGDDQDLGVVRSGHVVVGTAYRELPADIRLRLEWVLADAQRIRVQGASCSGREAGPVEEQARA